MVVGNGAQERSHIPLVLQDVRGGGRGEARGFRRDWGTALSDSDAP
jgi:hypothetical protein